MKSILYFLAVIFLFHSGYSCTLSKRAGLGFIPLNPTLFYLCEFISGLLCILLIIVGFIIHWWLPFLAFSISAILVNIIREINNLFLMWGMHTIISTMSSIIFSILLFFF